MQRSWLVLSVFGVRVPAPTLHSSRTMPLPAVFAAAIDLASVPRAGKLQLSPDAEGSWRVAWSSQGSLAAIFLKAGGPHNWASFEPGETF